jgi:hypothetical protein
MTALLYFVVILVVVGALYAFLRRPVSEYFKMRGARVVACPENEQPVAVRVDALHAAFTAAGGHEHFRLDSCSRWPEKAGCGQDCLKQIESQPMDCLVKTQVSRWYADKACAICGTALGIVDWAAHKPALRSPDGVTLEWSDVQPETMFEVMRSCQAICWDCHVAETFRRQRPDLVLDNPFSGPPPR